MAQESNHRDPENISGMIQKAASLSTQEVTDDELKLINKYKTLLEGEKLLGE